MKKKKLTNLEKSLIYWTERKQDIIFNTTVEQQQKAVKKIYSTAQRIIDKDVTELFIKMQEAGEVSTTQMLQQQRYKSLQENIQKQVRRINNIMSEATETGLLGAFKKVYKSTGDLIGLNNKSWSIINEQNAKEIVNGNFKGANFSQRIWTNTQKLKTQLEKSVIDSVTVGRSKDAAVKDMINRFDVSFNDADRLIRTEVQRVLNDGQKAAYKARGYTQIKWIVTKDDRLCKECMSYDRMIFDINGAPSVIHPRCRCTCIPVIDESLFDNPAAAELKEKLKKPEINNIYKNTNEAFNSFKLTGIEPEFAKEIDTQLLYLANKYTTAGKIDITTSTSDSYIGCFASGFETNKAGDLNFVNKIKFNKKIMNTKANATITQTHNARARKADNRTITPVWTVTHEYGHALDLDYLLRKNTKIRDNVNYFKSKPKIADVEIKDYNLLTQTNNDIQISEDRLSKVIKREMLQELNFVNRTELNYTIRKEFGEYAATTDAEFLAEGFAAMEHIEPEEQTEFLKTFAKIFNKLWNEVK